MGKYFNFNVKSSSKSKDRFVCIENEKCSMNNKFDKNTRFRRCMKIVHPIIDFKHCK